MSGRDLGLNASNDPCWFDVELTVRVIRAETLRQLAEIAAQNPDDLAWQFEQLAKELDRPVEGWDEAVADFEANTGLDEASARISEDEALRLADELRFAAGRTFAARSRASAAKLPRRQDRRSA